MKYIFSKHPLLQTVSINIIFIGIICLGFEAYLRYVSANEPTDWRIERFCNEAREHGYLLEDKTMYRNDRDGIYKFDKDSKMAFFFGGYNASGFTGNDLVPSDTEKPTVLFIGDSHTFGIDARPIMERRFVSRVDHAGYFTFNAGIGGLDVIQYWLIANKYIPELKPDYVALMLFLGNDINKPPSPVAPGKHLYFQTNFGGWVQGYDKYGYSFDSAYEAVDYRLIQQCRSSMNPAIRFLLGSRLFHKLYLFYYDYVKSFSRTLITNNGNEWVADKLESIAKLARQYDSTFVLFIIPKADSLSAGEIEDEIRFLRDRGFNPVYPDNLKRHDFQRRGGHMLNTGHRKYANFILEKLSGKY